MLEYRQKERLLSEKFLLAVNDDLRQFPCSLKACHIWAGGHQVGYAVHLADFY